jgi:hypothetical protein
MRFGCFAYTSAVAAAAAAAAVASAAARPGGGKRVVDVGMAKVGKSAVPFASSLVLLSSSSFAPFTPTIFPSFNSPLACTPYALASTQSRKHTVVCCTLPSPLGPYPSPSISPPPSSLPLFLALLASFPLFRLVLSSVRLFLSLSLFSIYIHNVRRIFFLSVYSLCPLPQSRPKSLRLRPAGRTAGGRGPDRARAHPSLYVYMMCASESVRRVRVCMCIRVRVCVCVYASESVCAYEVHYNVCQCIIM